MARVEARWASDELKEALAKLTSQQATGVLRIVQAELDGRSLSSLLDCPDQICTSTTYYGSGRRKGWKDKETFQRALDLARRDYRSWALEHGTGEALLILADSSPDAARALRHQVRGDEQALAALTALLDSEDDEERKTAVVGLYSTGLPQAVAPLLAAIEDEENMAIRLEIVKGLAHIAGLRDPERRLSSQGILDRAAVETAAKAALSVDEDNLDAAITRELERLATRGEDALSGETETDTDTEELQ
jgi:hypothetical protein